MERNDPDVYLLSLFIHSFFTLLGLVVMPLRLFSLGSNRRAISQWSLRAAARRSVSFSAWIGVHAA